MGTCVLNSPISSHSPNRCISWLSLIKKISKKNEYSFLFFPNGNKLLFLNLHNQGGRGHWIVFYTGAQSFITIIGLITLGTFIEFWLVGSELKESSNINLQIGQFCLSSLRMYPLISQHITGMQIVFVLNIVQSFCLDGRKIQRPMVYSINYVLTFIFEFKIFFRTKMYKTNRF